LSTSRSPADRYSSSRARQAWVTPPVQLEWGHVPNHLDDAAEQRLVAQPRLADAGLTDDQDEATVPADDRTAERLELGQLGGATDEVAHRKIVDHQLPVNCSAGQYRQT